MNVTVAANECRIIAPFAKFEKTDDGRLMVEGIATSEALDHAGEIVDYPTAKAAFAMWPGNIREQHDVKKAVGRAIEVVADDVTKTIRVKAFISKGAPDTQAKIMDGTLTAFSIGGGVSDRKAEKAKKADGAETDAIRLMIKNITETSVVDAGCNPDTAIRLVKMQGDQLVADGVEDAPEAIEVTGTDEQVAEFGKALNDAGLTLADAIALVKAGKPTAPPVDVKSALDCIERAAKAADVEKRLADPKLTMVDAASIAKDYDEPLGDVATLATRVLAKAGARHSTADMDRLQAAHDHLASMGAACSSGKADPAGDIAKAADLVQKVATLTAEVEKLKAQPMPTKVRLVSVAKSQDIDGTPAKGAEFTEEDFVHNTDGSVNKAATVIKLSQRLGGTPVDPRARA